ncbi:hypothetical protein NDU88_011310 [Pleurodeles waltl]|uniref:Uncharacterized protein n=1 Tax=Pleurodeles waltl TaxID=8319 RepID=A0AAV7R2P9_PLEWA|nr:hypothetical protein NDU88_011310 [Pleurodeles waltl]
MPRTIHNPSSSAVRTSVVLSRTAHSFSPLDAGFDRRRDPTAVGGRDATVRCGVTGVRIIVDLSKQKTLSKSVRITVIRISETAAVPLAVQV